MECPRCGAKVEAAWRFCDRCGAPVAPVQPPAQAAASPRRDMYGMLGWLEQEVVALRAEVADIFVALDAHGITIRRQAPAPTEIQGEPAAPPAPVAPPAPAPMQEAPAAALPVPVPIAEDRAPSASYSLSGVSAGPSAPAHRGVAVPMPEAVAAGGPPRRREPRFKAPRINWEFMVGVNWLAVIGAVAVVTGMGFFLKLAFDNGWINEPGRVLLGGGVGLASLGAGEYFNLRYKPWARAVSGGGIAILYLVLFAAFARYELIDSLPAFALFTAVTVAAGGLAYRYNSMVAAILGIIGGFATPLMLHENLPDAKLLLGYVLLLDVGVVGLAAARSWKWFTFLALIGSLADYGLWAAEFDPRDNLLLAEVGITLIYLLFVGATQVPALLRRRVPTANDYALMLVNVGAYFGISYGQMWDELRPLVGSYTIAVAAFHGGLGALALRCGTRSAPVERGALARDTARSHLGLMNLSFAAVLTTVFFPVQFEGPWLSVAWGAEAVAVSWLSYRLGMWQLRAFGLGAFGVAAAWLMAVDTPDALRGDLTPFGNEFLATFVLVSMAAFGMAFLLRRNASRSEAWERDLYPLFVGAGNIVVALIAPTQVDGVWITVTWAGEALAMLVAALMLGLPEVRWCSFGLFATMALRFAVVDTPEGLDAHVDLVTNTYTFAHVTGVASAFVAAWLVRRYRASLMPWEHQGAFPALVIGGCTLLTLALPVQVHGVWMTVAWAGEALALMALSLRLGVRELRWSSLGVFSVMAGRLFFEDASDAFEALRLDPFWNEFMWPFGVATGATYAAASLLHRYRERLDQWERTLFSVFVIGGSILLTVALPVQVEGVWMTVAWAAEALALMAAGVFLDVRELRWSSLGVFAVAVCRLLFVDTPVALDRTLDPFWNEFTVAYGVVIGGMYAAAALARSARGRLDEWERHVDAGLVVAGSVVMMVLMPIQTHGPWIPFAWVLEASVLLVAALWLGIEQLRWLSLAIFGAAMVRLLALDTPVDLEDYRPILNLRMLGFASAVAGMYGAAFLLWKRGRAIPEAGQVVPALIIAANFLTIYVLSAEIIATVDRGVVDVGGNTRNAKSLGLSLLWGAYGIVALTAGIVRGWRPLRQGGLGLLAVPVLKLFLYDAFELETGYRVAAFLVLGAMLLAGGFLYQRYSGAIKEFLFAPSDSGESKEEVQN